MYLRCISRYRNSNLLFSFVTNEIYIDRRVGFSCFFFLDYESEVGFCQKDVVFEYQKRNKRNRKKSYCTCFSCFFRLQVSILFLLKHVVFEHQKRGTECGRLLWDLLNGLGVSLRPTLLATGSIAPPKAFGPGTLINSTHYAAGGSIIYFK